MNVAKVDVTANKSLGKRFGIKVYYRPIHRFQKKQTHEVEATYVAMGAHVSFPCARGADGKINKIGSAWAGPHPVKCIRNNA